MFSRLFFSLAFFLLFATLPTAAAKRVALVIGNNAYSNLAPERQLIKAVNDARAVRDALDHELGFTVLYDEDADWARMNALMKQLEASIDDGDVVFFYFSGHGVSISGENFLLPSDIPTPRQGEESRLMGNSFGAEALTRRIQRRGARAIFVVLDACRDNPFVDEGGKGIGGDGGLTVIDAADGVFTLFAAGLGQKALDRLSDNDPNPNSIFTRNLIPLLKTAGLSQIDLAKKLQKEVEALAATVGHKQKPTFIDQISGFVTLKSGGPAPVDQPLSREERARLAWQDIKDLMTPDVFDAFAAQYPETVYADFALKQAAFLRVPKAIPQPEVIPQPAIAAPDDVVETGFPVGRVNTRWIVVTGSFPKSQRNKTLKRRNQLRKADFRAVIIDSDDYPNLAGGLYVVAVEAKSRTQALRLQGDIRGIIGDAYIKQAY